MGEWRLEVTLGADEREELERVRDTDPKAYRRERAAAILKLAERTSRTRVAQRGLLKRRRPSTVSGWLERYRAEGIAGLSVRAGRGRPPAFSPSMSRRGGRA